jgi:integrase
MAQAASAYLASIADENKRANHTERWNAVREFFGAGFGRAERFVSDIDSPTLMELVDWKRRNPKVTASTIRKDLVTVRQVLKHAVMRGVIASVPTFPGAQQIGSVATNPQPWITKNEWKHLMSLADQRIADAPNARTRAQRQELRDFCEFMWFTGLRVDEARTLQVRDVTVAYTAWMNGMPEDLLAPEALRSYNAIVGARVTFRESDDAVQAVQLPYLQIRVRRSKTGPRVCHSRIGAFQVFGRLTAGKKPTDLLFVEHHRDSFRELLIAADLRTNAYGLPRNAKCLRPTAISHWLLDKPTIPLSWLAANCGTSITILQQFYVKRLGLTLDGSAWL